MKEKQDNSTRTCELFKGWKKPKIQSKWHHTEQCETVFFYFKWHSTDPSTCLFWVCKLP